MIIEIESEGLEYAYKKGKISELEYNLYQRYIKMCIRDRLSPVLRGPSIPA